METLLVSSSRRDFMLLWISNSPSNSLSKGRLKLSEKIEVGGENDGSTKHNAHRTDRRASKEDYTSR